jgi:tRNA (guanine37-N1)-methyltransferase
MTPSGRTFNQKIAKELSKEENLIILCGHYEGVDQRVLDEIVTDEISIGDYVLTGGELPSMILIDCISRLIEGVLGNRESFVDESFYSGLLEYPQYTRPNEWNNRKVPEILISGHHEKVSKYQHEQSLIKTLKNRPDLLEKADLSDEDKKFIRSLQNGHVKE